MGRKMLIFLIGTFISYTSLCAQVKTISPQELEKLINDCKHDTNYILLDVRDVSEVKNGIIASEYCKPYHLSFNTKELENNYSILPEDTPIYIYCRTGNRSQQAADFLIKKGFNEVYSMSGGINSYDGELHDSSEFKSWSPLNVIEPSFTTGNCTSVLELSKSVNINSTISSESNLPPIITVNKIFSNGKANFTLSGKSIPELKTIRITGSYDPQTVIIMDALVSIKIPESIIGISVDTISHKIFLEINSVNSVNISDGSSIMILQAPIKGAGNPNINFIDAEIIGKDNIVMKANIYDNTSILPYVNNRYYNSSKDNNFTYSNVLLNGRVSNFKNYKGFFVEINKKKTKGRLNITKLCW